MKRIMVLQCPSCNANLNVDEGRKIFFCSWCGTKIQYDDGSKSFTYRKIDEARMREADVKESIRLKELEIQSKELSASHIKWIVWLTIVVTIGLIGIILMLTDRDYMTGLLFLIADFNIALVSGALMSEKKNEKNAG